MGMRVQVSTAALQHIRRHARASADHEVCGLLFGQEFRIDEARACANRAMTPATNFEIDAGALIAALREHRAGGARLIGYYHSHPRGSAVPSSRDAADAAPDGMLWLIAVDDEIRGWRATATGAINGRFDPVELVESAMSCASPCASSEQPQSKLGGVFPR